MLVGSRPAQKDLILSNFAAAAAPPAAYHVLAALAGMCKSVLLCSPHAALVVCSMVSAVDVRTAAG